MNLISFCIFIYLSAFNKVNSSKYQHINDCIFKKKSIIHGNDEVTFICGENDREKRVFTASNETDCSNLNIFYDKRYTWQGTVDFQNCSFPQINRNYFEMFANMHTFNISNVELETMQLNIFREATNVTILDISRNKLAQIPAHIFFNAKKLKSIDFSNNAISCIDPTAFEGATNLETLKLSHNSISKLQDALNLTTNVPKLLELDLSYNNITELTKHIFDKLGNLQLLNLSFNAIRKLDIEIFSCLMSLKHLSLKRTNLSNIELGTFSQQRNLVSLDLSENELTKVDFKLFLPVLPDLQTLNLAYNQLKKLYGFRSAIFPKLTSLQIRGNQFSCAYLANLFDLVNWEKMHPNSTVLNKSNILGIDCNDSAGDMGFDYENILTDGWNTITQNEETIRKTLTFICVTLTLFLILFTVASSNLFYNQFKKTFKICQRIRTYSAKANGNFVEFTNEQILQT